MDTSKNASPIVSRVVNPYQGYRYRAVFVLADGSAWIRKTDQREFVVRSRFEAVIRPEGGVTELFTLDLSGTSTVVLVRSYRAKARGYSAY